MPADIQIVTVSEKESRALNSRYRKKHKPANVLSFHYSKEYGEIIICLVVIRREAKAQKHSFEYQLAWMIVHGMIHLAGMHHEKSRMMTQKVVRIEDQVLEKLGLAELRIPKPK